jgi:protein YIPF5/7
MCYTIAFLQHRHELDQADVSASQLLKCSALRSCTPTLSSSVDKQVNFIMADPFGSPLPSQYAMPGPSYSNAQYRQGYTQPASDPYGHGGASTSASFEDEPPILEELGIDLGAILSKSKSVLIGRVGAESLNDVDMGGPLLFAAALAAMHLLYGKMHFGLILGWSVLSCTIFWFIVHQLAGLGVQSDKECIDLYNCSACLGYCLLPMVVMNAVDFFIPRFSPVSVALFAIASAYSALLAAKLVVKRAPFLQGQVSTIAYPAFLYYLTLSLISLY